MIVPKSCEGASPEDQEPDIGLFGKNLIANGILYSRFEWRIPVWMDIGGSDLRRRLATRQT